MLQPYDIGMLIILGAATVFGVIKGAAWQVASLASIVVSSMVAAHSSAAIAPYFPCKEPLNRYLAMLTLFVVTSAAIWILFRLVSNMIDRIKLKEFDRQIGAMVGFAKGVVYCIVITFFAVTLSEQTRQLVLDSRAGHIVAMAISKASPLLPEDVTSYLAEYISEFNRKLIEPPQVLPSGGTTTTPAPTVPKSPLNSKSQAGTTSMP
jgi:membrane protein required for colicin V production